MSEKDINRIMTADFSVPDACNNAAKDALEEIKKERADAKVGKRKAAAKRMRRLGAGSIAAVLLVALVCVGVTATQRNSRDAAGEQNAVQEAVDYKSLCLREIDKLKAVADSYGTAEGENDGNASGIADSVTARNAKLDKLIKSYEERLDNADDEADIQRLYEEISKSVKDCG